MCNILEMTSSTWPPTPSVDLDTIDTSLSDITVLENVNNSNRNSRSLEGSVQPIPDLIPKHFYQTSNEKVANDLEIKENGSLYFSLNVLACCENNVIFSCKTYSELNIEFSALQIYFCY